MSDEMERGERRDGNTVMEKLGFQRYIRGTRIIHLAKRIGVNHQVLSGYECGKHNVPFWVVEAICSVFGFRLIILDKKGKKIYENRCIE